MLLIALNEDCQKFDTLFNDIVSQHSCATGRDALWEQSIAAARGPNDIRALREGGLAGLRALPHARGRQRPKNYENALNLTITLQQH